MINIQEAFNTPLSSLTSVVFPPEDQDAIFNRELRIAIHNGRTLGQNSVLEGVWMGLSSLGAISEIQYMSLIAAYCNTSGRGCWSDYTDGKIIVHCGGTL